MKEDQHRVFRQAVVLGLPGGDDELTGCPRGGVP